MFFAKEVARKKSGWMGSIHPLTSVLCFFKRFAIP
jgi:hypothetical protein